MKRERDINTYIGAFLDGKEVEAKQLAAVLDKDPSNLSKQITSAGEDPINAFRLGWQLATAYNHLKLSEANR